jgi:hypothetical protein
VVRIPAEAGNFSLHHGVQTGSGAHPALFLGVKRPGREADHSPPSSAAVMIRVAIPPLPNTPPWRGARLKHRDSFICTSYEAHIECSQFDKSLTMKYIKSCVYKNPTQSAIQWVPV